MADEARLLAGFGGHFGLTLEAGHRRRRPRTIRVTPDQHQNYVGDA
jgi:hypothetical protein